MSRDDVLARIRIDPKVCFGKPCIKGHRIWVSLILDFLASGWSIPRVLPAGVQEDDSSGSGLGSSRDDGARSRRHSADAG
jgi:Protein of unknown function (DUF433)